MVFDLGVVLADIFFILIAYFSSYRLIQCLKNDPAFFIFVSKKTKNVCKMLDCRYTNKKSEFGFHWHISCEKINYDNHANNIEYVHCMHFGEKKICLAN